MKKANEPNLVRQNFRLVKKLYPDLAQGDLLRLRELTQAHLTFRLAGRDFVYRWKMVRDARGLLRIALRARCFGIRTASCKSDSPILSRAAGFSAQQFSSPVARRALSVMATPILPIRLP